MFCSPTYTDYRLCRNRLLPHSVRLDPAVNTIVSEQLVRVLHGIQLVHSTERDGTLAFLDCEFYEETDEQGRRVLSWRHYRKETSGIHVVPWQSAHTQVQKENYISSEVLRICKTCKYTKDSLTVVMPRSSWRSEEMHHAELSLLRRSRGRPEKTACLPTKDVALQGYVQALQPIVCWTNS